MSEYGAFNGTRLGIRNSRGAGRLAGIEVPLDGVLINEHLAHRLLQWLGGKHGAPGLVKARPNARSVGDATAVRAAKPTSFFRAGAHSLYLRAMQRDLDAAFLSCPFLEAKVAAAA